MKVFKIRRRFLKKAAALFVVLAVLCGCSSSKADGGGKQAERSLTLMTWNVYNLFDGKDNGCEYVEFLESSGWSTEKYLGRVNSITAAVGAITPSPDLIVLQEIESLAVVEDLARSISAGYKYCHFANNPGAALGLGVISRFPLTESKAHSITANNETIPRPVLETRIDTDEGSFVIFACHWKSKSGDGIAAENSRKSSARVVLRRIRELWQDEPELGIIVCGDLNESHDEFFRINAQRLCAVVPDDVYAAGITSRQTDFLIISENIPPLPVYFPDDAVVFFSPWTSELENGSYYYKNNWETIDHFLISRQFFNSKSWEYDRAILADFQPFVNSKGTPFLYNMKTGAGLSDHLPLLIILKSAG